MNPDMVLLEYIDTFRNNLVNTPVAEAYCQYLWWTENSGVNHVTKERFETFVCKKMRKMVETREVEVFKEMVE